MATTLPFKNVAVCIELYKLRHSNWLQKFAKWLNSSSTMTELFPTSKHCQTLICCRQKLKSNLSGLLLQKGGAEAFCPQSASLSPIVFEVLEKLNLFLQALPKPLSVPLLQTQRLAKNFLPLIISQWQAYTLCVWARACVSACVWVRARVCVKERDRKRDAQDFHGNS